MEDIIVMSTKELSRAEVFVNLQKRIITQKQAADNLDLRIKQGAKAPPSKKSTVTINSQEEASKKDPVWP